MSPQHFLGVFKNRVLRKIFGPNKERVRGGGRELYNEEHHNMYYFPLIIRVIK
jgi:hypothetical protein